MTLALNVYQEVIEAVITDVRDHFREEGTDEQVLQELRQLWTTKLSDLATCKRKEKKPDVVESEVMKGARLVPIQVTIPGPTEGEKRAITVVVPAEMLQLQQLRKVLTDNVLNAAKHLPQNMANNFLQQHVNRVLKNQAAGTSSAVSQFDGQHDDNDSQVGSSSSSDDVSDGVSDNDGMDEEDEDAALDEEPLNSGDDITDEEDAVEVFETDNVVLCQYDKIFRTKNRWKIQLKQGIINVNDEEYCFQKATGEALW